MTDQAAVDWPMCDEPGCIGIRLPRSGKCLAHATARQQKAAFKRLGETGQIDARGVPITEVLLQQILAAAPHDTANRPMFATARFNQATFGGDTEFGDATFQGEAWFTRATFQGHAGFRQATFQKDVRFDEATFQNEARFYGAIFQGEARFSRATFQGLTEFDVATFRSVAGFYGSTFQGDVGFREATFQGFTVFNRVTFQDDVRFSRATFGGVAAFDEATFRGIAAFDRATFRGVVSFREATFQGFAGFYGSTFQGGAQFVQATFQGDTWFRGATFWDDVRFNQATFGGDARFRGATFQDHARFEGVTFQGVAGFFGAIVRRDAWFIEARFEQARQLGPLLVYGLLRLDGAHFVQLTLIEASSRGLSCQRTRFPAGVQFRLRGAHVVLDDADLSSPSLLTGVDTLSEAQLTRREQRLVQAVRRLAPAAVEPYSARPRLLSVRGANLAGLSLAKIDLAPCRFAGAHNLDQLRFEAEVSFAAAPARLPWDWRQVLAEERAWRATRSDRWAAPDWWPAWLNWPYRSEWPQVVEPAQLAGLYRALRKAREDAKDEPGAADFYYGEMEMRRHARRGRTGEASRGQVERAVLTAYWLASGYGLRAWRALTALVMVLAAFAGLMVWEGYEEAASSPDVRSTPTTTAPTSPAAATNAPASPAASGADQSLVGSLLYGARTIIGLNPTPAPALTQFGEVLLIAVRVLGPLLLGLALLALRGRVKR